MSDASDPVRVSPVQVSLNPILLGILLFFAGSLMQAKTGFPFGGVVTTGGCKCDVRTPDPQRDQQGKRIGNPTGSPQ